MPGPLDMLRKLIPFGERISAEDLGIYILPQEFIPRGAQVFDQIKSVLVPIAGTVVAGFNFKTQQNRRGVLRFLCVDTFDPAGIPFIQFSVTRSGAPLSNYSRNDIPIGTLGEPTRVYAEFDRQQIFDVQLFNSSATQAYQVYVRAFLHFWDIQAETGR